MLENILEKFGPRCVLWKEFLVASIKVKQTSMIPILFTGCFELSGLDLFWTDLWQYGLWSFQAEDTKLERFLHKNQHSQRKLLNFEFWINGDQSKIGHHFSDKVI